MSSRMLSSNSRNRFNPIKLNLNSKNRTIWTNKTLISNSIKNLILNLNDTTTTATTKPDVTLFTISKNVPLKELDEILTILNSNSPSSSNNKSNTKGTVIGCLTEVLPTSLVQHLSSTSSSTPISSTSSSTKSETFSISLATFNSPPSSSSSTKVIPFQSNLIGRPNIQVGREIKQGPRSDPWGETLDNGFESFLTGQKWGFGEGPGEGRRGVIDELKDVDETKVKQIIYFTADRIQPFLTSLTKYTSSSTLGLVASSTPFHSSTQLPYSLYFNLTVASSGAVGVAILDSTSTSSNNKVDPIEIDYSGLEMLGSKMEVTSAKGNIILTLSEQNAARLLLKAVQDLPSTLAGGDAVTRGAEKEKEFFAAIFDSDPGSKPNYSNALHISKIMAGDPSRGAMSVNTEEEVKNGSWVIFLHRPTTSTPTFSPLLSPSSSPSSSFQFLSITPSNSFSPAPSPSSSSTSSSSPSSNEEVVVLKGFLSASENGVILSRIGLGEGEGGRGGNESWVCDTEGTVARIN